MDYTIKDHLLYFKGKQVKYVQTPNHGGTIVPKYLIMHYTAATTAAGSISWFASAKSQVSAQLLIDRDGTVVQFAAFNVQCWHAGQSKWGNIIGLNSHSIGIEFVNGGKLTQQLIGKDVVFSCPTDKKIVRDIEFAEGAHWHKYTAEQIEAGRQIWQLLDKEYNLKEILGHSDISPIRKIDPGPAFPWEVFKRVEPSAQNTLVETTTTVNVRSERRIADDTIIRTIAKGTKLEKIRDENGWTLIVAGTLNGWIKSEYLK